MIAQVTRLGLTVGDDDEVAAARERLQRDGCLLLPQFLAADLLQWFQRRLAGAEFQPRIHEHVDPPVTDQVLAAPDLDARLHFLINDPRLFALVERLTGCDPIGSYIGSVYQMRPGQGHVDAWHHDVDDSRMVTLSVNLSPQPYEGGVLQIMEWATKQIVHEVANTGAGDAILFPVALRWRHRVTEVTGPVPKMALAGWFGRTPSYAAWVGEKRQR